LKVIGVFHAIVNRAWNGPDSITYQAS